RFLSVRSIGAGTIWTVTVAERALVSRSEGSSRPSVATSRTRSRAPATDTASVTASVARITALSGPAISTDCGSALRCPTTKPGAGRPSTAGTTGTWRVADVSNTTAIADGMICTTSTPNGTRT